MKKARRIGKHKLDCWFRDDDTDPHGWFFNTYEGLHHDYVRGHHVVFMVCNCPDCPARLRIDLGMLEDFAVGAYAEDIA